MSRCFPAFVRPGQGAGVSRERGQGGATDAAVCQVAEGGSTGFLTPESAIRLMSRRPATGRMDEAGNANPGRDILVNVTEVPG